MKSPRNFRQTNLYKCTLSFASFYWCTHRECLFYCKYLWLNTSLELRNNFSVRLFLFLIPIFYQLKMAGIVWGSSHLVTPLLQKFSTNHSSIHVTETILLLWGEPIHEWNSKLNNNLEILTGTVDSCTTRKLMK